MAASRRFFTRYALALAALLSACAGDMRWTKANTDETEMAKDMAFCRKQAAATYGGAGSVAPQPQIDPRFGPTGPSQADRIMQESQAIGSCMRARGYTLVTVDKK